MGFTNLPTIGSDKLGSMSLKWNIRFWNFTKISKSSSMQKLETIPIAAATFQAFTQLRK